MRRGGSNGRQQRKQLKVRAYTTFAMRWLIRACRVSTRSTRH